MDRMNRNRQEEHRSFKRNALLFQTVFILRLHLNSVLSPLQNDKLFAINWISSIVVPLQI